MAKTHHRTIWISDTHLCSRDCRADYLLSFLKHNHCDTLYLVGDILDLWQMKRGLFWPQEFNNVIRRILGLSKKGTHVLYIPGNHDELLRDYIGFQFGGVEIVGHAVHTTANGRRLLVLHGDEFDMVVKCNKWLAVLGSAAYDNLIFLNRILNVFRRRLNLPYWSLAGFIKRKVKSAVTHIDSYENAAVHEAKRRHLDGVICGHIHQPALKSIDGLTYCNTGDWVENCTALVESASGELRIINWMKEWHENIRHTAVQPDMEADEALLADLVPVGVR